MIQLISLSDIQEFKELSSNINVGKKVNLYVIEAQKFDIVPFLGETLYILLENDFVQSPSLPTQIYRDLFEGSEYTVGTRTYRHEGIRSVLAYFSYGRIVANSKVNSTAFGIVEKTNSHSDGISEKTLARQVSMANALASGELARVEKFLCNNSKDYPDWIGYGSDNNRPRSGFRVSAIGGGNRKIGSSHRCRDCWRYTCIC